MARIPGSNGAEPYAKMQILAIADVIEPRIYNDSIKEWLSTVDLLVSCGDLPPYYLDFLMSTLGVPLVHVIGNHCIADHDLITKRCSPEAYPGAYNLDGRVVEYNGLILAGLEGSPLYNMGPHQYTEQQIAWKLLKLSPALLREKLNTGRYLDVMVTHAPPRGIHDNQDLAHKGFESLLGFIDRFKPALLLHGHTHRYDPMAATYTHHGSTDIINVYGHSIITLVRDSEHTGWTLAAVPAH